MIIDEFKNLIRGKASREGGSRKNLIRFPLSHGSIGGGLYDVVIFSRDRVQEAEKVLTETES